jgi:hypothetical protein
VVVGERGKELLMEWAKAKHSLQKSSIAPATALATIEWGLFRRKAAHTSSGEG